MSDGAQIATVIALAFTGLLAGWITVLKQRVKFLEADRENYRQMVSYRNARICKLQAKYDIDTASRDGKIERLLRDTDEVPVLHSKIAQLQAELDVVADQESEDIWDHRWIIS